MTENPLKFFSAHEVTETLEILYKAVILVKNYFTENKSSPLRSHYNRPDSKWDRQTGSFSALP